MVDEDASELLLASDLAALVEAPSDFAFAPLPSLLADSALVDAFESEPELTNPWFRSYRVTLGAGDTTDRHQHTTPVVIFQAIAGKAIANGPMDFEFNRPGQWAFYDAGVGHTMENLGDAAIELLEIEVRGR